MARPSKPEFHMGIALLAAKRSRDPVTKVGACIVKNNRVVSVGYNGMPNECEGKFPWGKGDTNQSLNSKMMYVCHAELNAIISSHGVDLRGSTMYVTHTPCNECAKIIVQCGIKEAFFLIPKFIDDPRGDASKSIFEAANVSCMKLTSEIKSITLDF